MISVVTVSLLDQALAVLAVFRYRAEKEVMAWSSVCFGFCHTGVVVLYTNS
jgi:hypothetical protein